MAPKRLMVAVDFGTTFSSVAFALSRKDEEPDPEVVTSWGDGTPKVSEVPTIVQYDSHVSIGRGTYKWGLHVSREEDNGRPIHEWFKLRLYPPVKEGLLRKYPSRAPRIDDEECERLIVDFLKAVRENFESVLKQKDAVLETIRREYIITVPAIWTDKAKDITRRCAVEAGMGGGYPIQIVKEPEAAGVYAIATQENLGLKVGDTFVICDAGGGTVDLVSYTIENLNPTRLAEAAEGSGGLCGSSFLNRAFEKYLDRKFRDFEMFDAGYKTDVMQYFENTIKPVYEGVNIGPPESYKVSVRGLKSTNSDMRRRLEDLGIVNERLKIPKRDLEPIFEEVVHEVNNLVQAQIRATRKRVRSVLLAGGFGESPFLRRRLQEHLTADARVIPINNSKTAIVRGALMRGLTRFDSNVPYPRPVTRQPTRSYGFVQRVDFDPSVHDRAKKYYDTNLGRDQIDVMYWCIEQGSLVRESEPQPKTQLCARHHTSEFPPMKIPVYTYERKQEGERPPLYKTSDLQKIVTLTAMLNRIPRDKLIEEHECYLAHFDVETTLNSANTLTFNLIVDGVRHPEESVGTTFV